MLADRESVWGVSRVSRRRRAGYGAGMGGFWFQLRVCLYLLAGGVVVFLLGLVSIILVAGSP